MGTVIFQGEQPFELVPQTAPTARSEGEIVFVTLCIPDPRIPQSVALVQLPLSLQHAEQLAAQLQPAIRMAQVSSRKGN